MKFLKEKVTEQKSHSPENKVVTAKNDQSYKILMYGQREAEYVRY